MNEQLYWHIQDIKKRERTYKNMKVEQGFNDLNFWLWRHKNFNGKNCIGCNTNTENYAELCEKCFLLYRAVLEEELGYISVTHKEEIQNEYINR